MKPVKTASPVVDMMLIMATVRGALDVHRLLPQESASAEIFSSTYLPMSPLGNGQEDQDQRRETEDVP